MTDRPIWPSEHDSTGQWATGPYGPTVAGEDATGPALGPAGEPLRPGPVWPAGAHSPSVGHYAPRGGQAVGAYGQASEVQPPFGLPPFGSPPPYGTISFDEQTSGSRGGSSRRLA